MSSSAALLLSRKSFGADRPGLPPLCIFSKHMAQFDYDQLAANAKRIGFEGVDLTVREKGHVLPERATQDMPRAVETLRKAGLMVPMITTGLLSTHDPAAKPTLMTAGQLKIPFWKPGYWRYEKRPVEQALADTQREAGALAALGKENGVTMGLHNHSGTYVGEAMWDNRAILASLDPAVAGYYFDPAHATVEGGLGGWKVSLELACSRLKMVALKDFYWAKDEKGWNVKWCPMGEGMVQWDAVFKAFAAAKFSGPFTLHVEYEPKDEMAAVEKDFAFMKKMRAKAFGG